MAREEKVMSSKEAIENFVHDGKKVAIGGMHMHNNPMGLVREIIRKKINIGTLVTSPSASINADMLIGSGLVSEVLSSYIGFEHLGLAPNFRAWAEAGKIKVRECDEAFIVYSLRAGASSLPFIPLPKGLEETDVPKANTEDYKETSDPFTGKKVMCIPAVQPDTAIVHCQKSDAYGNAIFEGSRFTDFEMIKASDKVILQVEEIVPNEYILTHSSRVSVPSFLVDAVVPIPFGCHPTSSHKYYGYDEKHLQEYLKASKEDFPSYLEKYVFTPKTNEDYLEAIGGRERIKELMEREIPW